MTSRDNEKLIQKINNFEDKLLDVEVEEKAKKRIHQKHKVFSEEEVFSNNGLKNINIDKNDGWE